jgi:hypothetical protein
MNLQMGVMEPNRGHVGLLGEVRIYNRAQGTAEIAAALPSAVR